MFIRQICCSLVIAFLGFTTIIQSQEPALSTKPLPEFLKNNGQVLEAIALQRNGKQGNHLAEGETIILIDRFFAWGGTWDQTVLSRKNDRTNVLSYAFDSSEQPFSSQVDELLRSSPNLDPLTISSKICYQFRHFRNRQLPPPLAKELPSEIESLQNTPDIKSGALDVHLVLIRLRSAKQSWWAIRDETQTSAGYKWLEGVLNFAKRNSAK